MDKFSPIKIDADKDPFNPNNWKDDADFVYRIPCLNSHHEAILDYEDYVHFSKWNWHSKLSKGGKKIYFCRTVWTAMHGRSNTTSLYLHKAIYERSGIKPPSFEYSIVDHRDGNSLDCRKANLRWATPSMNRRNINGQYSHELLGG